jgi:hypothetical protein
MIARVAALAVTASAIGALTVLPAAAGAASCQTGGLHGSFTNVATADQLDMSANASPASAIVGAGMR